MASQSTLLAAAAAATVGAAAAVLTVAPTETKKKKPGRKPKYLRPVINRPIRSSCDTTWRRLLTFRRAPDFIVYINITKSCLIERLIPLIEFERSSISYGSLYRKDPKSRRRRPQTIQFTSLAWICGILRGVTVCISSSLFSESLRRRPAFRWYSLELFLRVVRKRTNTDFEVRWPNIPEMQQSARTQP